MLKFSCFLVYKESMRRLGYRGGAFMSIFMIQRQADKGVLLTRILLDFIQMLPEVCLIPRLSHRP